MICSEIMPETCKYLKSNFNRATSFKVNLVTFCPELILRLFFKKWKNFLSIFMLLQHGIIKLTAVDSNTKTLPLEGMTNIRLRIMLPVQIPEGFKMTVANTEVSMQSLVVIDDSFEHAFNNENGKEKAIFFSLDVPHPGLQLLTYLPFRYLSYQRQITLRIVGYQLPIFFPTDSHP